jgi:hypothetical protein
MVRPRSPYLLDAPTGISIRRRARLHAGSITEKQGALETLAEEEYDDVDGR